MLQESPRLQDENPLVLLMRLKSPRVPPAANNYLNRDWPWYHQLGGEVITLKLLS